MLLSKVHDRSYSHIVDALLVSSDDYEECMQRLLDKHNMMHNNNDKGHLPRNINNTNSNNNRNKNRNKPRSNANNAGSNSNNGGNGGRNNNNPNNSSRIPNEVWKKMTREQKDAHYKKIGFDPNTKTWRNNNNNGQNSGPGARNNVRFGANTTRHIQSTNQWADQDNDNDEDDNEPAQPGTITARINSIMNSVRHTNVVLCHRALQGVPMALVDSGADTCLLGPEFHIESQSTDRFIDMQGFSGAASKVTNLPFGVGIGVVDMEDGAVMIRVNEGVVVPFPSILSANQMRSYATKVDDCPKRYGGKQQITLNDGPTMSLQYLNGLSYLPIRKPTNEELRTLPIHDITSAMLCGKSLLKAYSC